MTIKGDLTNILQEYLNRKTIENLEPELYFYKMGEKPTIPGGYQTLRWAKFTKVTAASVSTLSEGVTPSDTTFIAASAATVTPTDYGVVITITNPLLRDSVLDWLGGASKEVGSAMARKLDATVQTTIMAGTYVLYCSVDHSTRATLDATDWINASDLPRAAQYLKDKSAPTYDGLYVAIMHPFVVYDLMRSTVSGGWIDVNKYSKPENIFKGEIGAYGGVRIIECSYVQTFTSTVTVYPTLVFGRGAYGVGDFETLKAYITPATSSDSDPLVQRRKVGAKMAFGTTILDQDKMVRLESCATAITTGTVRPAALAE